MKRLTLLALLTLFAAGAFLLLHDDAPAVASPSASAPATDDASSAAKGPAPSKMSEELPASHRSVVATSQPAPEAGAATVDGDETDTWLEVRLVARETGAALAGARASVVPADAATWSMSHVDAAIGTEDQMLRAGEDGIVRFSVRPDVGYTVRGREGDAIGPASATARVSALRAGETRELELEIPTRADVAFFGRVLGADDVPIPDARVELPDGTWLDVSTNGDFELEARSWTSPWATASAPGFSSVQFDVHGSDTTPEARRTLTLRRSAILRVVVRGPAADGVTVLASTDPWYVAEGERAFSMVKPTWKAATGMDGRCELARLMPGAPLTIEVLRGSESLKLLPEAVVLEPGETREFEVVLGAGVALHGRAVDADGRPVSRLPVWLVAGAAASRYFQPYDEPAAKAVTGGQGEFSFDDVEPGSWWVGPATFRSDREPPSPDVFAPVAEHVELLPGESVRELTLVVHRGLYVRGVVRDPSGARVGAGTFVHAYSAELELSLTGRTGGDGSFAVGPLVPGSYRLVAQGFPTAFRGSEPVAAESGAVDVELRLRHGVSVSGKAVDATTGVATKAQVTLSRPAGGGQDELITMSWPAKATFAFQGLVAGTYNLCATTDDGRVGVTTVTVGESGTDGVVLAVEPGGWLALRYDGESDYGQVQVWLGEALVGADGLARGTSARWAVPPGSLRVRCTDGEGPTDEWVEVAVGETSERSLR